MPRKIIGRAKPTKETNLSSGADAFTIRQDGFKDRFKFADTDISADKIRSAVTAAGSGNLGLLHEVFERMERGSTFYGGLVGMLKSGMAGQKLHISPAVGTNKSEQNLADEFAQLMDVQLKILDTHKANKLFVEAYLRGVRIIDTKLELYDFPQNRTFAFVSEEGIQAIPGSRYRWETTVQHEGRKLSPDRGDWGELMIAFPFEPHPVPLSQLNRDRLVVLTESQEPGRWDKMGAGRKCVTWWLLKAYTQQWWAEFAEVYGKPTRMAHYPKNSSPETLETIREFLQLLGEDAYGMFPEGVKVDLVEANRGGNISTFKDIINTANQEMSIALVGQTETSLSPDEGGAGARAAVLSNIRREILKEISRYIQEGYKQIAHMIVRANYGEELAIKRLLPTVKPSIVTQQEKTSKLDRATMMIERGIPVIIEELYEQSGMQLPVAGDTVIRGTEIGKFLGFDEHVVGEEEIDPTDDTEDETENNEEENETENGEEEDETPTDDDEPRENPEEPSEDTERRREEN